MTAETEGLRVVTSDPSLVFGADDVEIFRLIQPLGDEVFSCNNKPSLDLDLVSERSSPRP